MMVRVRGVVSALQGQDGPRGIRRVYLLAISAQFYGKIQIGCKQWYLEYILQIICS
jgi:hypothetical protein